jgi:hypothetical protein
VALPGGVAHAMLETRCYAASLLYVGIRDAYRGWKETLAVGWLPGFVVVFRGYSEWEDIGSRGPDCRGAVKPSIGP